MFYDALVNSPIGQILLKADQGGLAGLYFTDQRDCPAKDGMPEKHSVEKPADGMLGNRPLRKFKLKSRSRKRQAGLFSRPGMATDFINTSKDFLTELEKIDFSKPVISDAAMPDAVRQVLLQSAAELDEYWHGKRVLFTIPLNPHGTSFQKQVWQALLQIPLGQTMSYGELGKLAGFGAKHGRAIGSAVGSNPVSIIIPCHRVLAANGTLNGYGGGLNRKAYLLQLEGFNLV